MIEGLGRWRYPEPDTGSPGDMPLSSEPLVVAFCCNWCAYAGADLAGVSRLQHPPNVRIIRVMCSGRVEPGMVLRCLRQGADGVMVLGCHIGDCHYRIGNLQAEKRTDVTKRLLERMGIEPERLLLRWISAGEAALFSRTCEDFIAQLRLLGPLREVDHGCE